MGTVTLDLQILDVGREEGMEAGDGSFWTGSTAYYVASNTDPSSADYLCFGGRFKAVTIPSYGATITAAYLELYVHSAVNDDANFVLYGNKVVDAQDFEDEADVIGRSRTTASVSVVKNSAGVGWFGSDYDIKTIVQEIIDQVGWAPGNNLAMLLIAKTDIDYEYLGFYSGRQGALPVWGAKLHVEYDYDPLSIPFTPTLPGGSMLYPRALDIALPKRTLAVSLPKRTLDVHLKGR